MTKNMLPQGGSEWMRWVEQQLRILGRHTHGNSSIDNYLMRARNMIGGGGLRTVTSAGVSWSGRFTVIDAGRNASIAPDGYFTISMPPDGTVITVHGASTPTTTI